MSTQTEIFRRIVHDHMAAAPLTLPRGATLSEAVEGMRATSSSSVVVVDARGRPVGIMTEQDVVRRITWRAVPDQTVETVMSSPVVTVKADDYLFHAIGLMRQRKLRQVPVVDGDGRVVGCLQRHEALEQSVEPSVRLIDRLTHEESVDGLQRVKEAQIEVADQLLRDGAPASEVLALLSEVNADIHRRILRREMADVAEQGWGNPPVGFALIIMGSGGRGENLLVPDQDHGLILADYEDAEHNRIDPYFVELASRLAQTLDAVGFPLCRGNVMATSPVWRKTITQWRAQVDLWLRRRAEVLLRNCDIFFDFRHTYGDDDLSRQLRDHVTNRSAQSPLFLRDMFALDADHTVALGWLGRLATQRDSEHQGNMLDLKYRGTLPLAETVRVLALKARIAATPTLVRIDSLARQGIIHAQDHERLKNAFEFMNWLILRQQIDDHRAGRKVGHLVDEQGLSKRERKHLVACFRTVENLRATLRMEFGGSPEL